MHWSLHFQDKRRNRLSSILRSSGRHTLMVKVALQPHEDATKLVITSYGNFGAQLSAFTSVSPLQSSSEQLGTDLVIATSGAPSFARGQTPCAYKITQFHLLRSFQTPISLVYENLKLHIRPLTSYSSRLPTRRPLSTLISLSADLQSLSCTEITQNDRPHS